MTTITDVHDSYHTVGFKLLSAFKWINEASKISKPKWILKLDDDVLLNVEKLKNILQNFEAHKQNIIYCNVYNVVEPFRDPDSKW